MLERITVSALAALVALVAGCTSARAPMLSTPEGAAWLPAPHARGGFAVARPATDALGYSGPITVEGVAALKLADDPAVRSLRIRSPGGNLEAGIQLGEWVHARGLDVVVVDFCVLACANYVFPAGSHKTILPGAVVAWHGDAHGDLGVERHISAGEVAQLRNDEDALFAHLGVSECLTRYGDEHTSGANWARFWELRARMGFYTMSPTDMQRFGVTNVDGDPPGRDTVNPTVSKWLDLEFVSLPASFDGRTACR